MMRRDLDSSLAEALRGFWVSNSVSALISLYVLKQRLNIAMSLHTHASTLSFNESALLQNQLHDHNYYYNNTLIRFITHLILMLGRQIPYRIAIRTAEITPRVTQTRIAFFLVSRTCSSNFN